MGDIGVANWMYYYGKGLATGRVFSSMKEIHQNSTYLKDRYSKGFEKSLESYSEGTSKLPPLLPGLGSETLMGISLAFSKAGDAGAIYLGGVPNYMYYKERYLKTILMPLNKKLLILQ